jgi:hypothetical protein
LFTKLGFVDRMTVQRQTQTEFNDLRIYLRNVGLLDDELTSSGSAAKASCGYVLDDKCINK